MRMRSMIGGVVVLVASACAAPPTASPTPGTTSTAGTHGMSMSPGATMPSTGPPSAPAVAFGRPGDPMKSSHVVEVRLLDTLQFKPALIRVTSGETVTFEIKNEGAINHEFVLGDSAFQQQHEAEMAGMDGSMPTDEPNAVTVQPGFTKTVVWNFTSPGKVAFGCHEPGHFEEGMKGVVEVAPSR